MVVVVRTIQLLRPYYRPKKNLLKLSFVLYIGVWVVLTSFELVYLSHEKTLQQFLIPTIGGEFIKKIIRFDAYPREEIIRLYWIIAMVVCCIVPYILPAIISVISCLIQTVVLVNKIRSRQRTSKSTRQLNKMNTRVTITIFYLTGLFVCCNSVYFFSFMYLWKAQTGINSYLNWVIMKCHGTGVVTTFLNSALNPVILILRGKDLKGFIKNAIMGEQTTTYVIQNLAITSRIGVSNVRATTNV